MATAQSRLDILINAKNAASPQLKQVTGDVQGLGSAASTLSKGLAGLALAGGVAGLAALGGAAFDLARTGAEAERLGTAFGTLASSAGQSSQAMIEAMRAASQGTINDTDLMLAANKAMLLGVADSSEEMAGLLEVAAARGKAMGLSTAQAFSDIVTGIGRMSPLILDNLGITVDAAKANADYAESIGKTASQLTDQEKKQALVNQVIANSTDLVRANNALGRDAAGSFERMDAAISNAKTALGELFSPAAAVVAEQIANAAEATAEAMIAQKAAGEAGQQATLFNTGAAISYQTEQVNMLRDAIMGLEVGTDAWFRMHMAISEGTDRIIAFANEYNAAAAATGAPLIDIDQLRQGVVAYDEAAAGLNRVKVAALDAGRGVQEAGLMASLAAEKFQALFSLTRDIGSAIDSAAAGAGAMFAGERGGAAGLSRQKDLTTELKSQVVLWKLQGYTLKEIDDVLLPGYISQINKADRALFSTATSTKKISEEAKTAEQAFNDLRGKVQGVLSGALNTGVASGESLLESMGLRSDAINEDARRLADVAVKGWESPWADYFRTKFPQLFDDMYFGGDNIKAIAAQQLKDFEDGLNPALIDKERAKDRIRRMLLGEANMAELALEIANELAAEMGVPLQQALATAQGTLGVGGSTGAGTEAAQTFQDGALQGIEERNGGGAMVDNFISQARANYAKLKTAGIDAGRQWGAGFMETVGESVPPALVDLLTNLVTPGVMAKIAQQGTLTGATP